MSALDEMKAALAALDEPYHAGGSEHVKRIWNAIDKARALVVEHEALVASEAARVRDVEYPDFTPESVVDAAFAGEAGWWRPGESAPVQPVLVPDFLERVAGAAYRATLAHLASEG